MRGDVEGGIWRAERVDEDAAEDAFEDAGVESVDCGALVCEVSRRQVRDFDYPWAGWVEDLVKNGEVIDRVVLGARAEKVVVGYPRDDQALN